MAVGGDVGPDGVKDGTMSLRAYEVPDAASAAFGNFSYAGGMISTQESHDQLYGYWEVGLRINELDKGTHFTLALFPQDNSWPPEIDLMELVYNNANQDSKPPSQWYSNAHGGGAGAQMHSKGDWEGWHKIGFEWTASTLRWTYDDVVVREEPNYINKPMYFVAAWEVGSYWSGAPNPGDGMLGDVELDYVRTYEASPGASGKDVPEGYKLAWGDEFNKSSIGTDSGDKFAPYFTGWNSRRIVGNNDQAIKVADDERASSGGGTYGEALAATGDYGDGPYFHHYNMPAASPPTTSPPPSGKPVKIKVVASGDSGGGDANDGPQPKMVLLVDGDQVGDAIAVKAKHEKDKWQTVKFKADISDAHEVAIKYVNDWSHPVGTSDILDDSDRNLYIDQIKIGKSSLTAEQGEFVNDSGGRKTGSEDLPGNGSLVFDVDKLVHSG